MLVLSRKLNETIRISDKISITVIAIDSGVVKLGIQAPADITVHRGEVYERIQAENQRAALGIPVKMSTLARYWREQKKQAAIGGASASGCALPDND